MRDRHEGARWATRGAMASIAAAALVASACGLTEEKQLPPDVKDPTLVQTPAGAMNFYRKVVGRFPGTFDLVMATTGILTDELAALTVPPLYAGNYTNVDSRQDLTGLSESHSDSLHRLRAQAREARGFLTTYAPDSSLALQGHLYAIEGYAEIFLADLFCSGIPLSTVDFNGDYTLRPGSTTTEVYTHAAALFDTALTLLSDSAELQHFAAIGRGRALLGAGRAADAAAAVAAVPDGYRYRATVPTRELLAEFAANYRNTSSAIARGTPSVANQQGINGLAFRSGGDPRSVAIVPDTTKDQFGNTMYVAAKYPVSGAVTLVVADGIEARLIEAEAALAADPSGGGWLEVLNHLRQTAWTTIMPAVAGPLDDLTDPGTPAARLNLLFRERAFWLYLTAHRQGDLRRLIRVYGRDPTTVYPVGPYPGGTGVHGNEIVVPTPPSEQKFNPHYAGCFHRNA